MCFLGTLYLLSDDNFLLNWQVIKRKHHSPVEVTITIQRSDEIEWRLQDYRVEKFQLILVQLLSFESLSLLELTNLKSRKQKLKKKLKKKTDSQRCRVVTLESMDKIEYHLYSELQKWVTKEDVSTVSHGGNRCCFPGARVLFVTLYTGAVPSMSLSTYLITNCYADTRWNQKVKQVYL